MNVYMACIYACTLCIGMCDAYMHVYIVYACSNIHTCICVYIFTCTYIHKLWIHTRVCVCNASILYMCSSFIAKEDHAIRGIMTWLALDFVFNEGGLCRSPASLLLQSHLNPVTRYSSGWLEMAQDEAVGVKWLAQGHTASECQVSEVRFELRSSWLLHWCSIHCTT